MTTPQRRIRIVVTGGPGGGKSTAADIFRREIGDKVVVVPESATLLFSGGFPRFSDEPARKAAQRAIFHVQKNLEDTQASAYPDRILLCDRGTVDGAAYWPGPPVAFFDALNTTLEEQLARYDACIFFESAAAGGMAIEGGNPARIESNAEAARLDRALNDIWSKHPRFVFIANNHSFFRKLSNGFAALQRIVTELGGGSYFPPAG